MRASHLFFVAAVVLAATSADARADAPWSQPTLTSGAMELAPVAPPTLFGLTNSVPEAGPRRIVGAMVRSGVPGPTVASDSPRDLNLVRVLDDGRIVAGVVLGRRAGPPQAGLVRGRLGRPLGSPRSLRGRSKASFLLDVVTNDAGDAVAAVRRCQTRGCGRQTLELIRWRAGVARLGKARRIARGGKLGAGVGLNARGDVAVVWDRLPSGGGARRAIYGQVLSAGGRLGPRRLLAHPSSAPSYRVAITNTRRVVAAWLAQPVSECVAHPGEIEVAQAAPGRRFTPAQRLARLRITGCGRYAQAPGVAFARGADGRVVIAWSGNEGGRWVVRAGELGPAGVTGAAVVSDRATDAVLSDLEVGPHGEAIILLADGVGGSDPTGPRRLLAVTRAPGAGAFGAPEVVTSEIDLGGTLAFDAATGSPVAAYLTHGPDFLPTTAVVSRAG